MAFTKNMTEEGAKKFFARLNNNRIRNYQNRLNRYAKQLKTETDPDEIEYITERTAACRVLLDRFINEAIS